MDDGRSMVVTDSKERQKALAAALAQIEKQFGKGSIMRLADGEVAEDIQVVSTGSLGLDIALGVGGLPRGRVRRGLRSGILRQDDAHAAGHRRDAEDRRHLLPSSTPSTRSTSQYAQKLGVNLQDLLVSQPDTGEQALEITDALVRSGSVDLIVIDSVAALTPKAEIEGEMGDSLPGLQARLMSQALRKLTGTIKRTNCLVIFINQIRMKIGVMFGNPETTTGGNALKFYASVRLDIRRIGSIKKGDEVIGSETKVKVVKNKVAPPFKQATFDILYGEGISREGEIVDLGSELNIVEKSGAWYSYDGDRIGQGKDNAREYLRNNPAMARRDREQDPRRQGRERRVPRMSQPADVGRMAAARERAGCQPARSAPSRCSRAANTVGTNWRASSCVGSRKARIAPTSTPCSTNCSVATCFRTSVSPPSLVRTRAARYGDARLKQDLKARGVPAPIATRPRRSCRRRRFGVASVRAPSGLVASAPRRTPCRSGRARRASWSRAASAPTSYARSCAGSPGDDDCRDLSAAVRSRGPEGGLAAALGAAPQSGATRGHLTGCLARPLNGGVSAASLC